MVHRKIKLSSASIKNFARKLGADLVGIASIDNYKGALEKQKPALYLPKAESLISIGVRIPNSVLDSLPHSRRSYTATFNTVNAKLNDIAYGLTILLENNGYPAVNYSAGPPFDEELLIGDISHRHVALKAGLGEIGYSGLLLTPQYGPRVRFNTVTTEAKLKPDSPYQGPKLCKYPDCIKCVEVCPPEAQASTMIEYVYPIGRAFDKQKCRRYARETLKGLVCGMCIKVCPIVKNV